MELKSKEVDVPKSEWGGKKKWFRKGRNVRNAGSQAGTAR